MMLEGAMESKTDPWLVVAAMVWVAVMAAVIAISAGCSQPPKSCDHCDCSPVKPVSPDAFSGVQRDLYAISGYLRHSSGRHPQLLDAGLSERAKDWASRMASDGRLRHSDYRIAENVAAGQRSPAEVMRAWMSSSGHRANLLGPHQRVGFGAAQDQRGRWYWCAMFDSPRDTGSGTGATGSETSEPSPDDDPGAGAAEAK